ncbi:hypothetical protein ABZ635_18100 [Nocardiopsis sp. NPDC007018]|uniref:hypothetical protein n=1 Tax=Nocardiopsis sp. NPDC007018 TaxID=3155721 RepID=UPI00340B7D54
MYSTPPSGPQQPYGQGQPPQPQQGGYGYPQQPVPHGHGPAQPYGAPGGPVPPPHFNGAPGAPATLPGPGVTVRVLMFIGGPVGILLGLILAVVVMLGVGVGVAANSASETGGADIMGMVGALGALGFLFALIPLTYGIISTVLATKMGQQKKGVYWGVVAFNIVASLFLVLGVISALAMETAPSNVVPLAFHATMTGLMFAPSVRRFYGV